MAVVEFRLLGPVEAVRDGDSLPLGGRRQRALLALLLLEPGRPATADWLVEELWQGRPPAGASTTLRSYVSRLRNVLGAEAPLTGSAAGYSLDVPRERVDVRGFEQLTREGEEALAAGRAWRAERRLRSALGLWRASPFADLAQDGALRAEAERLEQVRLRALEGRIEADLALGRDAELVEELEALVQENPYRERLWRQLMLALYRAGRQATALEEYRRVRTILSDELGLEPGEELKRLEQAILRHEVPPVEPPTERHNLPAAVTSFVGREAELADVSRLLDEARLVTLTGIGGVGKTRLALEAAHRAVADFADGVVFVDLAPISEPELVGRHAAGALDVPEQAGVSAEDQLAGRLRESELLLVLDNCEHVREAAARLVQTLLTACPHLCSLATSREHLGLTGEVDYPVPPLTLPPADANPDELRSSEAVGLLLARVREARPRLDEDGALVSAGAICRDLDGLPLAIELAAARAKALSLDEIAARLADRFRFLVSWRRLTTARHRTLREAMDWSYELLSADEQAFLARLAAFAGGFTLAAAASVCLDGDEERALELVERLVDASLVVSEERGDAMRYRLLETVRQYAAERLDESGAVEEAAAGHGAFFTALAEAADLRGPEQSRSIALLDAELDNLRAAIDAAVSRGDVETELRLVGAAWRYWWLRGHLEEGRRRVEAALARGAEGDGELHSRVLYGGGILAWCVGDYERGREIAAHLLERARVTGSLWEEHDGNKVLSMIALRERDFAGSERYSSRTVELAQELGSKADLLIAKLNHAVLYLDWGRFEAAVPAFEEALADYRRAGIVEGVGLALLNLGEAEYRLRDFEPAEAHFEEARAAFGAIGFRQHEGRALQGLAAVAATRGDHMEVARRLGRAASVLVGLGASEDDFVPALAADVEAEARARLGDEEFAAAHDAGRRAEAARTTAATP